MLPLNSRRMQDAFRHATALVSAVLVLALTVAAPSTMSAAVPAEAPADSEQPAPAPFMVRILSPVAEPAQSTLASLRRSSAVPRPAGGADDAAKARLQKYYDILSAKLRAVPGLQLITEETPGVPGVPYEITIRPGANWQGVYIEGSSVRAPNGYKVLWISTDAPSFLASVLRLTALLDDTPPEDPDREMANYVERLRLEIFPPDRAFLDQKVSDLRNAQLDVNSRRYALFQLMKSETRPDSYGGGLPPTTYRPSPAVLDVATDVAMTASDPAMRLQIWATLSSRGIPRVDPVVLTAPAQRALGRESDLRVQLMLVDILTMNPRAESARAALDALAHSEADSDRPELVRMAARRVVDGSAVWNDYLIARLKDAQMPDGERIELIDYMHRLSGNADLSPGDASMELDEAAQSALANLMRQAPTDVALAAARLMRQAGGDATREEFTEFLRAGTGQPGADNKVRRSVMLALAYELRSHPELRAVYEDIRARDLDPALREAAQQALDENSSGFSIGAAFQAPAVSP